MAFHVSPFGISPTNKRISVEGKEKEVAKEAVLRGVPGNIV